MIKAGFKSVCRVFYVRHFLNYMHALRKTLSLSINKLTGDFGVAIFWRLKNGFKSCHESKGFVPTRGRQSPALKMDRQGIAYFRPARLGRGGHIIGLYYRPAYFPDFRQL
ncbi:hypothetical protein, partial [Serratia entomophila]|uniref:hypothetical protein n=1 Tax=Serratia entomophila TaxID=42906 RepID=UPI0021B80F2C